jgi:hypothetical protein
MRVWVRDTAGLPYVAESWENQPPDWPLANGIDLSGGSAVDIDMALADGTLLSGTILTQFDGPLQNGGVTAWRVSDGAWMAFNHVEGNGNWNMALPPGDYVLLFDAWGDWDQYVDVFSDGVTDFACPDTNCDFLAHAPVVSLVDGVPQVINNTLDMGFYVEGNITDANGGAGLGDVRIEFRKADGSLVYPAHSRWDDGWYRSPALPTEVVYVVAKGTPISYGSEIYDDVSCTFGDCTTVMGDPGVVHVDDTTPGTTRTVSFDLPYLSADWTISGHIWDANGNPLVGGNVHCSTRTVTGLVTGGSMKTAISKATP